MAFEDDSYLKRTPQACIKKEISLHIVKKMEEKVALYNILFSVEKTLSASHLLTEWQGSNLLL